MKRYAIQLLLITLPFLLNAQAPPGQLDFLVLERTTKETIPFCTVVIYSKGSVVFSQASDFDGKASFKAVPQGNYIAVISSMGMKTDSLSIDVVDDSQLSFTIELEIESNNLQEIVLSENRMIEPGRTSTIVSSEHIQRLPMRSQTRIAALTPGVHLRGARAGANQTFIDGVKVRGSAHVPHDAIERKSLIQSGLPAKYESTKPEEIAIDRRVVPDVTHVYVHQIKHYYHTEEEYIPLFENKFEITHGNPLSTFSIDVDGAAYANTRRFLNGGVLPPQDAVRIEELINYFSYDYEAPTGEHPISIHTELATCPWNEEHALLHVGLKSKDIVEEVSVRQNLVFLIDVSGSMSSYNKLDLVKQSLKLLVNELDSEDLITIVVYAGASGLVLEPTEISQKDMIFNAIDRLSAGGSTAGGAGIQLAYKKGAEHFIEGGNNRVILCTDGDFNVGITDRNQLIKLIEKKRESGIFLSVLGFGTGNLHDATMEQLANNGNGNYNYIDHLKEARKVLVHELRGTMFAVAKDVKFQLEFNPALVKGYRLIGYENRLLADADFNDDTKDAGEMGAGHTVTAIYELIPATTTNKNEVFVDDLKYASSMNNAFPKEWMTIKLRYKLPDGKTSTKMEHIVSGEPTTFKKASNDLRFASAVAAYGMLIRGSSFSGKSTFDGVKEWAKGAKGKDENGYRSEFIQMVDLTKDILATGYTNE